MSSPVLVELEVEHNCWCIDLSQQYGGVNIVATPLASPQKDVTAWMYDVRSSQEKDAFHFIKSHPHIRHADVLHATKQGQLVYVLQQANTLFIEAAAQHHGVAVENPVISQGRDRLVLLFPNERNMRKMRSELRGDFLIHPRAKMYIRKKESFGLDFFRSSGYVQLKTVSNILTQRQRDIFLLACRRGYYRNPQETSLQDLAQEYGIHPNTASEHLRRAEAKLMPVFGKILRHL